MANKDLTLKLLREANEVYPDGVIEGYFDLDTGKRRKEETTWDTLALFVGNEILAAVDSDTTEEEARLRIGQMMETAIEELSAIKRHFEARL